MSDSTSEADEAKEEDFERVARRFTPDQVFERAFLLYQCCNDFIEERNRDPASRLKFDPLIIVNVAQSAMDDIWRFKVYHLEDHKKLSDAIKRAAYFAKWIVRLRPVYFDRVGYDMDPTQTVSPTDKSLMANELFAMHMAQVMISEHLEADYIHIAPPLLAIWLYDLRYRTMSEDALMSIFEMVAMVLDEDETIVMKVFDKED